MECTETRELLGAYVDSELELTRALEIQKHVSSCADCQRMYEQLTELRSTLREQTAYFAAPQKLRNDIRAALRENEKPAAQARERRWLLVNFGAALAFAVLLTWGLTGYWSAQSLDQRLPGEVVSGHVRSLLANHLVDVASSDQHTVKPWFSGKLDFSPPVRDLTAQGFPLIGGRLDYIDNRQVAALVYRHREHAINLFVWPSASGQDVAPQSLRKQGYQLINWSESGMFFCAVSDVSASEIMQFARTFSSKSDPGSANGSL